MSAVEALPLSRVKLSVWQIVKYAYRHSWRERGAFFASAAVPCLLMIVLDVVLAETPSISAAPLIRLGVSGVLFALFDLAWLHFLLQRGSAARPPWLPRPDRRLLPFCGYGLLTLLLYFPAALYTYADAKYGEPGSTAMYLPIGLMFLGATHLNLRFSFAFLWIAVGSRERFRASWQRTKGNGWRLVVISILVSLPVFLVTIALGTIFVLLIPDAATNARGWTHWTDIAMTQALLFAYSGLSCAAAVGAFENLTGWVSDNREVLERFE